MKAQIQSMIDKLTSMLEKAEELADSDNETTAERYEQVVECLNAALEPLEEAIALWD